MALGLTEYDRVVHFDSDGLVFKNLGEPQEASMSFLSSFPITLTLIRFRPTFSTLPTFQITSSSLLKQASLFLVLTG